MDKKKFGIQEVVATGIGTALFVVLTTVQIPTGIPNTALQPRMAVLAFFAAVFGPIVGGIVGLLGHALGDALFYGSVWWSWVFSSAIFGFVMGCTKKLYGLNDGEFGTKQIVRFNVSQLIGHIIAWGIAAPALDILIYAEPASKVFLQGIVAGVSNIVTTAIVGTILCVAYAAARPKKGSLKEE